MPAGFLLATILGTACLLIASTIYLLVSAVGVLEPSQGHSQPKGRDQNGVNCPVEEASSGYSNTSFVSWPPQLGSSRQLRVDLGTLLAWLLLAPLAITLWP